MWLGPGCVCCSGEGEDGSWHFRLCLCRPSVMDLAKRKQEVCANLLRCATVVNAVQLLLFEDLEPLRLEFGFQLNTRFLNAASKEPTKMF